MLGSSSTTASTPTQVLTPPGSPSPLTPAWVLADLTGVSISTAERWSQWAKRDRTAPVRRIDAPSLAWFEADAEAGAVVEVVVEPAETGADA